MSKSVVACLGHLRMKAPHEMAIDVGKTWRKVNDKGVCRRGEMEGCAKKGDLYREVKGEEESRWLSDWPRYS